jgi:hypothetical protein
METNEFIFRDIRVILAKLVILKMREEETKAGAVIEKKESYVIFFFFKKIISHIRFLADAGMTHVCRKSLLLYLKILFRLGMRTGPLRFYHGQNVK